MGEAEGGMDGEPYKETGDPVRLPAQVAGDT